MKCRDCAREIAADEPRQPTLEFGKPLCQHCVRWKDVMSRFDDPDVEIRRGAR